MITQEYLKEYLLYDPHTGLFSWRKNPSGVRKGRVTGCPNGRGYLLIGLNKKIYRAHRLAFLYMTGSIPKEVDHINGIGDDNRWCNLRPATRSQNTRNIRRGITNKSGVKGVAWCKQHKKWRARIWLNNKEIFIGRYYDLIGAELAVRKKRIELHGEFANHG